MTFSGQLENPRRKPIVDFIYHDMFFKLAFVSYDIDRDESLYQVVNLPTLGKLPAFKALANEWREKYDNDFGITFILCYHHGV